MGLHEPCEDGECLIRNLDTGQCRSFMESTVDKSFLPDDYTLLDRLRRRPWKRWRAEQRKCRGVPSRRPWELWWAEKRARDEQLWLAAEFGNLDSLREVLMQPEDSSGPSVSVNSTSQHGRTALHLAASAGSVESTELLLGAGADLGASTDAGLTALHIASQCGHVSIVALLLNWGADICSETKDRNLPIHFAAMNGHVDVVSLLLERSDWDQCAAIRNSAGQRPSEVAMDIRTADAFRHHENKMCNSPRSTGEGSPLSPAKDSYARRTPLRGGVVLLRNARADVVSRVLHRRSAGKSMLGDDHEEVQMKSSKKASAARAPFARLRGGEPGVEEVGPGCFLLMDKLGKGTFGEVFQVKHKRTDQVYAMKTLQKSKITKRNMMRYVLTERNLLSYMNHPFIVSLHYAFQTRSYLVLVLQLCSGGSLGQLLKTVKTLKEPLAKLYTAEILLALSHLHERHVVFRDLKPDNVVLDEAGHAMLTDFGLAKQGVSALHGTRSFCGSLAYIAPEILQRRLQRHTVDIYGLGALLFNMLTGRPPFYNPDRQKLENNIRHAPLVLPPCMSNPAGSIIHALMVRDPSRRLGAADTNDVKKHRFFRNTDFEALLRREVPVPLVGTQSPSSFASKSTCHSEKLKTLRDKGFRRWQDVSGWAFSSAVC